MGSVKVSDLGWPLKGQDSMSQVRYDIFWPKSRIMFPFQSMAESNVAENAILVKIGRRLFGVWRHSSVTWSDSVIFFHQKFRKGCPISYAKFQADPPSASGAIPEKLMGGCITPPPRAGEGWPLTRGQIWRHLSERTFRGLPNILIGCFPPKKVTGIRALNR